MTDTTTRRPKPETTTQQFRNTLAIVVLTIILTISVAGTTVFAFSSSFTINISSADAILISLTALQSIIAGLAIFFTIAGLFSLSFIRDLISQNVNEKVEQRIDGVELRSHITSEIDRRFADDGELNQRFRDDMEQMIDTLIDKKFARERIEQTDFGKGDD